MRQSIIFILYLLCTFTARSQSALTPEQAGSIYYAYPVPSSTYTPAPVPIRQQKALGRGMFVI